MQAACGGAGKATFQELTLTKRPDAATTQLYEFLVIGEHLNALAITQGNVTWELSLVMIQDYSSRGSESDEEPVEETWTLQFGSMKVIVDDSKRVTISSPFR